jgi:phage-related protein
MAEFVWFESHGTSRRHKPRVKQITYGDGYEARIGTGINAQPQVWDLVFSGGAYEQITGIEDFLKARGGIESFGWTTPRGEAIRVVCREWTRTYDSGAECSLRATFEQVFEP